MYLKSLEIVGFKSFATRTILNFHRGVTAVVGPNGCGKSNVLDSVRWVLGEQSAKALRGGEMADVIFNGTESRKPLGMAEVSLTFADCEEALGVDWNEVRISRRVYRDGRGEYLLNKSPCRLRDIQSLFMDTGIGRTAYSIMEQGRIDQILSSRPEDRRAIFEEAAGVTKYKAQRKEALRKLDYTEANLVRHTDIIKEVKRQIGSLQRQAGKARRYRAFMEDLRALDTHWSHEQYQALRREHDSHEKAARGLDESITQLQSDLETEQERVTGRRREIEETDEQTQEARQKAQDIRSRIIAAENRLELNRERAEEYGGLTEQYRLDIAGAEEKLQVQENQLQETDHQLEGLSHSLAEEESRLEHHRRRMEELRARCAEAEAQATEADRAVSRAENAAHQARLQQESKANDLASSSDRLKTLERDYQTAHEEATTLEKQLQSLQQQVETSENALRKLREELQTSETALKEKSRTLSEADQALDVLRKDQTSKESRLEVLKQLNKEGEGLNRGSQALLKGLEDPDFYKPTILGALASMIEVEEASIPAIEAALGRSLQTVVLKDLDAALKAFDSIGQQKLGRTLLGAMELLPRPHDTQLETLPEGALAWAGDKVQATPEVAPLIAKLLENTVIAENLEAGLMIKQQLPSCCVTTLKGELITREGLIEGGVDDEAATGASILQRKNQIRRLEEELTGLAAAIGEAVERRDELEAARASLDTQVTELRESLQQRQVDLGALRGQLSMVEREFRQAKGNVESLSWEQQELGQRRERISGEVETLSARITELDRERAEAEIRRDEAGRQLEELRREETECSERLNELRIRVATEKQREENLRRQRQPMAARLEELRELVTRRQEDIRGYAERLENLETENESLKGTLEENRGALGEADAEVTKLQEQRAVQVRGIEELEGRLRAVRQKLDQQQNAKNEHHLAVSQVQLRLENLAEYAAHRYQVNLEEFQTDSYLLVTTLKRLQEKSKRSLAAEPEPDPEPETVTDSTTPEIETPESEEDSEPADEEPGAPIKQEIDWEGVQVAIAELKEKVDAMGPVNLEAIQEFEELEERQTFLEEQYNDLVASKNELLEVISRINNTTKSLFAETFEKIRDNFQEMFRELFGGGRANLVMVDDSDPLESGIEIIAKPPGKQLQSISLLSGGERTMTAVALLFSIYMVKPSPFCILDEMDAPLDESNINRFLNILDRFVSQSQFVVITHNKRTISRADILYGVTMEEHGISKLVGVKFSRKGDPVPGGEAPQAVTSEEPAESTPVG